MTGGRHPTGVRLLQVEPTTRCNFTCGFCVGRGLDQSDLSLDDYGRALEQFPELERVELHGEGEPTLHPRLAEMARLARESGASVSTITNGSLLTRERADAILAAGIDALFVSIESAEPGDFQAIRGGKLSRVVEGIRTLLAARRERGLARPTVGFSVTVLKRTQAALNGIVKLYQELGLDGGISLHMLNRMASYTVHYSPEMHEQTLSREDQALAWLRYARAVRSQGVTGAALHFSDEVFGQLPGSAARDSARAAREYRSCIWLDCGLYLNRHGQTSGCARIKDTSAFGFGGIRDTDPREIVAARDAMARRLRSGLVPAACDGCFVADSIAARMSNLLDRRLRPADPGQATPAGSESSEAIGEVPRDAGAEAWLLATADGERTARDIIAEVARREGLEAEAARVRLLPVLGELVRRRALAVEPARAPAR
jgi:MoaA/NifB/PqqE/SkfB family radical SAM enzyme